MKLWHRHQLIITCKLCEDCRADLVQSILTTTCAALSWKQERSRSRQPVPPDNYLELNTMINLASARKLSHFFYRLFRLKIQSWYKSKEKKLYLFTWLLFLLCLFACLLVSLKRVFLLLAVLSVLRHHQSIVASKQKVPPKAKKMVNSASFQKK